MPRLYSPLERQLALEKLESWVDSTRHRADRDRAISTFLAALDGVTEEKDLDRGLAHGNIQELLTDFLCADVAIGRGPCPALGLLESSKGARLPAGSRRFLRLLGLSTLGVFEVTAVDPGRSCTLRELVSGEKRVISERSATLRMARGDILGARVIDGTEGQPVFEDLLILPGTPQQARRRVDEMTAAYAAEAAKDDLPGLDQPEGMLVFAKDLAPRLARWWFEDIFGQPEESELCPVIVNGEVYEPGISEYVVPPDFPLCTAMAAAPGLVEIQPGTWNLYQPCPEGRRLVGSASLDQDSSFYPVLVLLSSGRQSMKRLRKVVKAALGPAIQHLKTRYEAPRLVPPHRAGPFDTYETPIDLEAHGIDPEAPDAAERLKRAVRQDQLERWIDLPIPALGDITPRQAARRPELRSELVRLLRDFETSDDALAERDGSGRLDFEPLWRELGLTEPLESGAGQG